MKQALHFGGGSIGIGFIADLLYESGYEVTIVDIDRDLVQQINETNTFDLYLINEGYQKKQLTNLHALSSIEDQKEIIEKIRTTELITTAVWAENLPKIAPVLLKGLKKRVAENGQRVTILACENAMFNSEILRNAILALDASAKVWLDQIAAFPNTAVDRMVLASEHQDKKTIDIGRDYELVIEESKLVDPTDKPIKDAVYTTDLKKYIERKLYVVNCGHAWAGYIGFVHGYSVMRDVFSNEELVQLIRETMWESAHLLMEKHGFTEQDMADYIDFIMDRYQTPGITDMITRVSRSPIRKLQPEERLVGPCVQCEEHGLKNTRLLEGIAAAFLFDNPEDEQSVELLAFVAEHGIDQAIVHFTTISAGTRMHQVIKGNYQKFLTKQRRVK
ncbi:mannitol-1-phosphate 5-dehydrogenase [Enterococcus florum]|uniref:Mannitol-1-phosphate 5-dehydrogenase n=1 Tax=Enterococcus florum TaxID=2480627 RepID=A0A4P5PLM8_9ENTE|nr:mannitol dehydrogenase [Enterococcus florum]GCF94173.1 mannitol-1-phosphate 5-dehydrogenase [Enterococcus florum]